VFISQNRAYMLSPQLDVIVVWDPSAMEISRTISLELSDIGASGTGGPTLSGFETFAHKGQQVGDSVIWQLVGTNWDTNEIHRVTTLLIVSATADGPARLVEDPRCAGANGGYVDAQGDFYVRADAYWGYFAAYGDQTAAVRSCVLRIRAGEEEFDPDYLVDMTELTGTPINYPWFHVQGGQYLAQAWDSSRTVPVDTSEYWYADMVPMLLDIEAKTSEPYPDIDGTIMVSSAEYDVDGVHYYELNEQGFVVGGRSDIVELHPEGVVRKFTVPGLWALARIR